MGSWIISRERYPTDGISSVIPIPWYGMAWNTMVWYGMVWYGMVWYGIPWYGMVWLSQYQSQNLLLGLQSYLGHLCLDARCNYLLHHFRPLMKMLIRMSRSLLFLEAACNFSCERVNWCNWQFRFNFSNSFREGAKLFTIWCLWLSYYYCYYCCLTLNLISLWQEGQLDPNQGR